MSHSMSSNCINNDIVNDNNDKITLLSLPINILNMIIQCLDNVNSLVCLDNAYCNHANR